jgi:hypothetical protein
MFFLRLNLISVRHCAGYYHEFIIALVHSKKGAKVVATVVRCVSLGERHSLLSFQYPAHLDTTDESVMEVVSKNTETRAVFFLDI